jgi:dihydrofolate reductase
MLKMVVAIAANGIIGRGNTLPWYLPDDLRRFKEVTTGKTIVQGSNTYRSIISRNGKPLPNRHTIVLTSTPENPEFQGVETTDRWQSIVVRAEHEDIFVIGGAKVYAQFLPYAQELHLTRVNSHVQGDALFPEWDISEWERISYEPHFKSGRNEFDFTFEIYRRITGLKTLDHTIASA